MTNPTMVLKHGGGMYTVTSSLAAPQALPPGTYTVHFDPMTGYSISTLPDLEAPTYRVYGRRDKSIDKVIRTYAHLDRSLGVLFEGDKGIGKSSTTIELARRMCTEHALPVFLINHNYPGLSDFLAGLGECVIVFDEFEKTFPINDDDGRNQQNQFLTLFDGTDNAKRLYIVTVNDTRKLSPFLLNRPGRFHYLFSFDYPDLDAITEYVRNEAPSASDKQMSDAVAFAFRARLNYDHLRALATELTIAGPDAPVAELVADLNIRDTEDRNYDVKATLEDGTVLTSFNHEMELFLRSDDPDDYENVRFLVSDHSEPEITLQVKFRGADADFNRRTKKLTVEPAMIRDQRLFFHPDIARKLPSDVLESFSWSSGWLEVVLDGVEEPLFANLRVSKLELVPAAQDHARFF